MIGSDVDQGASLRWSLYLILIAIAAGNMTGRLMAVNSVDKGLFEKVRIRDRLQQERTRLAEVGVEGEKLENRLDAYETRIKGLLKLQRPFLSANDRSRWMTVRALVEQGNYEIDGIVGQPTWDTIDMVQHRGRDGELHLYSSKPPLLMTLIAGEYWVLHRLTGMTLGTHPYVLGRVMLVTINILPLLLMYVLLARLVERLGTTDWGRVFVMATATLGTLLTTFAVVLNNHIVGAVSAAVALYYFVRIWCDEDRRASSFAMAGLAAAFTAANELPALALLVFMGLMLRWKAPRQTTVAFLPAMFLVVAAFFTTNYLAHESIRPPYMHRSETNPEDQWYKFTYEVNGRERQSYWNDRQGIDQGEASRGTYAMHTLVGHHGIFSLTPVWLLSVWGLGIWLRSGRGAPRDLARLIALLSVICLVFYIGLRPIEDRNYGGMTSGFRWMFWFAPLWLVGMLPAVDRLSRSRGGQALALALLAFSVLSVSYPTWNPWTHPWIYHWLYTGR